MIDRTQYYTEWWRTVKNDPVRLAEIYEKRREARKKRKAADPSRYAENARKRTALWRQENPEMYLWQSARASARPRGLDFSINVEDISIPKLCPYLGIPLTCIQGEGMVDSNISLDRIDNTKGYIKGNVEVISMLANRMKLKASKEQLVTFAKSVLSRYG